MTENNTSGTIKNLNTKQVSYSAMTNGPQYMNAVLKVMKTRASTGR